jgi:hypothetical protein
MFEEKVTEIASILAPYGKTIALQNIAYENDTKVLRMRIREGSRFTIIDMDDNTANQLSALLSDWTKQG